MGKEGRGEGKKRTRGTTCVCAEHNNAPGDITNYVSAEIPHFRASFSRHLDSKLVFFFSFALDDLYFFFSSMVSLIFRER